MRLTLFAAVFDCADDSIRLKKVLDTVMICSHSHIMIANVLF